MSESNALMEKVLDGLVGPRESFRKDLKPESVLRRICNYAKRMAKGSYYSPEHYIGEITGHGSGVSRAIYELYRERKDARDDGTDAA